MQRERIYSAPSLIEVVKQLLIYRLTGVLTFWPAKASRQEFVRMTVEQGRPLRVFWGATHQENINSSILEWLNNWGEIHFSFLATDARLQLPSPKSHPFQQTSHSGQPSHRASVTQPLSALPPTSGNSSSPSNNGSSAFHGPETIVAFLTPHGQRFPAANLPRHERTIFLLINGRRTLVDIAQLTKRTPDEVYATLYYLYNMQLITINTLPPHK